MGLDFSEGRQHAKREPANVSGTGISQRQYVFFLISQKLVKIQPRKPSGSLILADVVLEGLGDPVLGTLTMTFG